MWTELKWLMASKRKRALMLARVMVVPCAGSPETLRLRRLEWMGLRPSVGGHVVGAHYERVNVAGWPSTSPVVSVLLSEGTLWLCVSTEWLELDRWASAKAAALAACPKTTP